MLGVLEANRARTIEFQNHMSPGCSGIGDWIPCRSRSIQKQNEVRQAVLPDVAVAKVGVAIGAFQEIHRVASLKRRTAGEGVDLGQACEGIGS